MPRAQSQGGPSSLQAPSQLLKRNQACHQCRRRNDAQKPCSTCVRSHRFAASNNPTLLQTQPECTYDDLTSDGSPVVKPRTKYKILEDRISELEDLLRKQLTKEPSNAFTSLPTTTPLPESAHLDDPHQISWENTSHVWANILEPQPNTSPGQSLSIHSVGNTTTNLLEQQLISSDWPTRLPRRDVLHHLVDVFFSCYPHAYYLIHRPTFMMSLTLSPKSSKFPHASLLHAICAYGGVFSYLVEPPPLPDLDKLHDDIIFGEQRQSGYTRKEESFAERHARWSKETRDEAVAMGFNLLECMQSIMILTCFYHVQGRWVELWTSAGHALRCAVPLGLNARLGYCGDGTIQDPELIPDGSESLLPKPANFVEQEQRVNLFWIAYLADRFQNAPSSWALSIDDQDVHQVLPCDLVHFESGYDVEGPRQSLESPGVLLQHLPETTDSFSLYIKGAILVSKTRSFNLRIRHRYPTTSDIRELPEFHQLEQKIKLFRKSFPQRYHNPTVQSSRGLDIHVYAAHLIPNYAMILLHEKHANLHSPNCLSTQKTITAARAILDLMYAVCATSYDITRLAPICPHCWYKAGSFLTRVFKLEISRGRHEEALAVDLELQAIRLSLNQMGARIPLALRYNKVLDYELQAKTSQLNHSLSQQCVTADRDSDSQVSPGIASSKPSGSPWSNLLYSGSGEEPPPLPGYMDGSADQTLSAEDPPFALGAASVDGSSLPLPDPGSVSLDELVRPFSTGSF